MYASHNHKNISNINKSDKCSPNQLRVADIILNLPSLIACAFNQHFSSVCADLIPNRVNMTSHSTSVCQSTFNFYTITPTDVCNAICDLKESSGPGLDGIETRFIKLASHIVIYPLADLFNLSLRTCEIPAIWKSAHITPLHKGGDTLDPNNYRPISIICSIAKIFEKNIYNQLSQYLNDTNILSQYQFGFRANFSTTTALLKLKTNDVFLHLIVVISLEQYLLILPKPLIWWITIFF